MGNSKSYDDNGNGRYYNDRYGNSGNNKNASINNLNFAPYGIKTNK